MQNPEKTFAVHVPQRCIARISLESSQYLIDALHTDDFSTCLIICLLSKDKAVLIHADALMINTIAEDISRQMQWLGHDSEAIILFRETGRLLYDAYLALIKHLLPQKKAHKLLDNNDGEIVVSLTHFAGIDGKNIHQNIRVRASSFLHMRPDNLIHHPDEIKFLTVIKIKQLVGLRAAVATKTLRRSNPLIFSEHHWLAKDPHDLEIDISHATTEKEMSIFNRTDTFQILNQKLTQLVNELKKDKDIFMHVSSTAGIAYHLENYLNNVADLNPDKLFIKNFFEFLLNIQSTIKDDTDKNYFELLKSALDSDSQQFRKITEIIEKYKSNSTESEFNNKVGDFFSTCSRNYLDRQYYKKYQIKCQTIKAVCEKMKPAAAQHIQSQEYESARNYYVSILNKSIHCYVDSDNELTSAFYNLGQCFFKLGQNEKANACLTICLGLRINSRASVSDILQVQRALANCLASQNATPAKSGATITSKR